MKLLTKDTDYAIRALLVLAGEEGKYVSAREIAGKQGIPYEYVRKILQKLIKEEFVASREGGKGGFRLSRAPERIKVVSIIKAFQGEIQLSECVFRKKICPKRSLCALRKNIERINGLVEKEFGKMTISGLVRDLKKGEK